MIELLTYIILGFLVFFFIVVPVLVAGATVLLSVGAVLAAVFRRAA